MTFSNHKTQLMCISILGAITLSACQSSHPPAPPPHNQAMQHMQERGSDKMLDRMNARWDNLDPEQKAEMEQRHAERTMQWQQVQQACQGKTVGQAIQVKIGERVIDGSCEMHFVKKPR